MRFLWSNETAKTTPQTHGARSLDRTSSIASRHRASSAGSAPCGLPSCQHQVSRSIASSPRSARQPSYRSTLAASAQKATRSPSRRGAMQYGNRWPVTRSKVATISSTATHRSNADAVARWLPGRSKATRHRSVVCSGGGQHASVQTTFIVDHAYHPRCRARPLPKHDVDIPLRGALDL